MHSIASIFMSKSQMTLHIYVKQIIFNCIWKIYSWKSNFAFIWNMSSLKIKVNSYFFSTKCLLLKCFKRIYVMIMQFRLLPDNFGKFNFVDKGNMLFFIHGKYLAFKTILFLKKWSIPKIFWLTRIPWYILEILLSYKLLRRL